MEENIRLNFNLDTDRFSLLENDDYCSIAEIDFLHLGLNRNKCNITEECVRKSLNSFYNKPLLCILNNSVISELSTDFKEHARSINDKKKMIAFGTIPESSDFQFIKRDNGKIYLNAKVVIWKNYFPVIMNILKRREGNVKVSIELAVISGNQDKDSGILDIYEFRLLSCVLLGEEVMEGIEGSHLEMLRFSLDNNVLQEANKHYLDFSYKNEKHAISEDILNSVQIELDNYKRTGKGYTNLDLELAKKIVNNKYIENKDVDRMVEKKSPLAQLFEGIIEERGVLLVNSLSNNELQERIWNELEKYKYKDGDWEGRKYYVEEIYSDEKVIIVRDNETAEYYKIPYSINEGKVSIQMDNKKEVHKSYEEKKVFSAFTSVVFAKKDYGTGESIKVDKSKEAMSDSAWGSVNKTELRKKVLEAKNYKSLVKDVYALVEEGWEEAPSSKLKYPIMEIKDGKAVYNRYGLASALAYAQKENETAVITKVKSLYKKLDIDNEDEGGEKEMAKELDEDKKEEVVENKLDKDNKDIEKIKDDAEAQEDDVKEKEKKNAAEEEIIENKIEKDDEGEEDLEDDVDSDKDYWKEKANALEVKNAEIEAELKKYKRAEEEKEMACEIDKFAHCMSEDEAKELKESIKECSLEEMKNKIDEKVRGFALKMKEEKPEKKEEVSYSVNPLFEINKLGFSKKEANELDTIINNGVVKIK